MLGPSISVLSTNAAPWLGAMTPARILSSVVFPQPVGPTTARNSPASTRAVVGASATLSRPARLRYVFERPSMRNDLPPDSLACIPAVPRVQEPEKGVEQDAEDADHDHTDQHLVGAQNIHAVCDQIAETRACGDELGCDDRSPARSERDAQTRHDARQGCGQDHTTE